MKELIHSTGWLEAARHVNTSISPPSRDPPRTNARAALKTGHRLIGVREPPRTNARAALKTGHRLIGLRSEEHTSELQSPCNLVCRLLLEKKQEKREPPAGQTHGTPLADARKALTAHHPDTRRTSPSGAGQHDALRNYFFFFNDTAATEIYTLSLHDALPI